MRRFRSARMKTPRGWGFAGGGAGVKKAQTASADRDQGRGTESGACPTIEATPPSTGPKRAPTIAAAIASPIVWPRRSAGVAPTSHVSRRSRRTRCRSPARSARGRGRRSNLPVAKIIVVSAITSDAGDRRGPRAEAGGGEAARDPSERARRSGTRLRAPRRPPSRGRTRRRSRAAAASAPTKNIVSTKTISADEEEQTAHAVSRSSRAFAARGTRAGRPGPRRSSASAPRARRGRVRRPGSGRTRRFASRTAAGPEARSSATTASTSWRDLADEADAERDVRSRTARRSGSSGARLPAPILASTNGEITAGMIPSFTSEKPNDGIVGGDGDVGASGESATAAEAVALDPGHDGSGASVDRSEHPVQAERVLDVLLVAEVDRRALPVDVGAGAEALALTRQDDGPRVANVGEGLGQLANELRVEGVSPLGLVDRDSEDGPSRSMRSAPMRVSLDSQHAERSARRCRDASSGRRRGSRRGRVRALRRLPGRRRARRDPRARHDRRGNPALGERAPASGGAVHPAAARASTSPFTAALRRRPRRLRWRRMRQRRAQMRSR